MSDESDDKTEAPTPHRLEKAREEGQIPRSRELTSLLILLVGVSVIWFGGVSLARRLSGMLSAGLHFDHSIINDPNLILGQIILLLKEAMLALMPLIVGVMVVALRGANDAWCLLWFQRRIDDVNPMSLTRTRYGTDILARTADE
ncbi:EscU/YscU/HrcU family type III secretion system export apparatus switch protein [Escherichia coli]